MSRLKIVLHNPHATFFTMPLALVALGSSLDRQRYDVVIVDGRLEEDPVTRVLAEARDALCLGVPPLSGAPLRDGLRVTRAVKERCPDLPTIWGGWHPSLFPVKTLDEPSIDVAVLGQGELTFAEIVERLAGGMGLGMVRGICHRRDGAPIQELARWRCSRDEYRMPVEKRLVEMIRPAAELSSTERGRGEEK